MSLLFFLMIILCYWFYITIYSCRNKSFKIALKDEIKGMGITFIEKISIKQVMFASPIAKTRDGNYL